MVEEEKKEISTEEKKEVKYKVTNAVPQDPTLPREINLATIKAFNKKKLKYIFLLRQLDNGRPRGVSFFLFEIFLVAHNHKFYLSRLRYNNWKCF